MIPIPDLQRVVILNLLVSCYPELSFPFTLKRYSLLFQFLQEAIS